MKTVNQLLPSNFFLPLFLALWEALRLLRRRFRYLRPAFLLLPLLLTNAGCNAKLGNSDSTSSNTIDDSTTDNSVTGSTDCRVTCDTKPDGSTEFVEECNGGEVSDQSFDAGIKPCPTPSPSPTPTPTAAA